jgi:hypothetical protein
LSHLRAAKTDWHWTMLIRPLDPESESDVRFVLSSLPCESAIPRDACLIETAAHGKGESTMVSVSKYKLNGIGRTWNATCITVDLHGHWLFCPAGETGRDLHGAPMPPHSTAGIQLFPANQPWTAWWLADPRCLGIDVIKPIVPGGPEHIIYHDLELDIWWRDGDGRIVDQDELQEAVDRGLLAPDVAAQATRIAEELLVRLRSGDPLFTETGFAYLDAAIAGRRSPR